MGAYRPALRSYEWVDQDVEEIEERIGYDGDFPTNYNPEVTEFMTIEAPPVGEFWGEPQTYRPVTMAQRLDSRQSEYIEDVWPKLLWLANWYQPGIPIATVYKQFFLNTENWVWDRDEPVWDYAGVSTRLMPHRLHAFGDRIFADPDNPK